jgi:ribosomal protein S27AE
MFTKFVKTIKYSSVKGAVGEGLTRLFTSGLNSEEYHKIHNLLITHEDGQTTQIDHVFISQYGIFVIETKNFKGWILGNEENKYWTQVIYKNKEKLYNPIWQNRGHIKALQNILKDFGELHFISIIAFSPRSTLKNISIESDHVYVNYQMNVSKIIRNYQEVVMSGFQARKIYEKLETINIKGLDAKINHAENIQLNLKQQQMVRINNICPRCGDELVIRNGKHGNFKGCSGFPKCKYTEKC